MRLGQCALWSMTRLKIMEPEGSAAASRSWVCVRPGLCGALGPEGKGHEDRLDPGEDHDHLRLLEKALAQCCSQRKEGHGTAVALKTEKSPAGCG